MRGHELLRTGLAIVAALGLVIQTSTVLADDAKPAADAAPATITVKKGRFQVPIKLEGIFVSDQQHEISLKPDSWSEFIVAEAVEHGRAVKQGDTLLKLDRRKFEQTLQDERDALRLAELAIAQLEAELAIREPNLSAELAMSERTNKNAIADLDNFLKVERDLDQRQAEQYLKSAEQYVDYAKDELDQLEKMYKADDLTEETEEIILKRQRQQYEQTKFYLEISKTERDQTLKVRLPRREADLREGAQRAQIEFDHSRSTLPLQVTKLKGDLEKQRHDHAKAKDKLARIERDAELFTIVAPVDGVVYYGACKEGEWSTGAGVAEKLRPGAALSAHEVLVTIVDLRLMSVHAAVAEKDLAQLGAKTNCQITPAGDATVRLAGALETIDSVPRPSGKFTATIKLAEVPQDSGKLRVVPGMKCAVRAAVYDANNVISIPQTALQTDDFDDQAFFVNIVGDDGHSTRRDVKVGHRRDDAVEIISGLNEGEKILRQKPAEK